MSTGACAGLEQRAGAGADFLLALSLAEMVGVTREGGVFREEETESAKADGEEKSRLTAEMVGGLVLLPCAV